MAGKVITVDQFLTAQEIKSCVAIWDTDRNNCHRRIMAEIIEPNMARINKALGQENDPGFLAYAVEYVLMQSEGSK